MKKIFSLLLVLLLCFSFAGSIFAQDSDLPEDADPTNESVEAGLEDLVTKAGNSAMANRIRYIPIEVDVTSSEVVVYGYFVNLNRSATVKNFRDFTMSLYEDGDLLVSGNFGTINSFTLPPLSVYYQTFTFNGRNNLRNGNYGCDDGTYAYTGFNFTSVN